MVRKAYVSLRPTRSKNAASREKRSFTCSLVGYVDRRGDSTTISWALLQGGLNKTGPIGSGLGPTGPDTRPCAH